MAVSLFRSAAATSIAEPVPSMPADWVTFVNVPAPLFCLRQVEEFVKDQVSSGRRVRIHVIALGDYFDQDFGGFLTRLAKMTGGTFLGR